MEAILKFLWILSFPFSIGSIAILLIRILGWYDYNYGKHSEVYRTALYLQGRELIFPMKIPVVLLVVSLSAFIAFFPS